MSLSPKIRPLDFLKLLKLHRNVHFIEFIVGYAIAITSSGSAPELIKLLLIFISFSVLFYSGIYIINDLIDLPRDRKHPTKRLRPVASGAIKPNVAFAIAVVLMLLGSILGYFIDHVVLYFEILFLSINLTYSIVLKNIPYLDLFSNAITHPLRLIFAICVFAKLDAIHWPVIAGITTMSLMLSALKRYKELNEEGYNFRPSLKRYSTRGLSLLMIVCCLILFILLFFVDNPLAFSFIITGALVSLVSVAGYTMSKGKIRRIISHILTS